MNITAYIISCPQRAELLQATLTSLKQSDWVGEPVIVADQSRHSDGRVRQTETSLRLLQQAVADGAPFFCFFEDDLSFNKYILYNIYNWPPFQQCNQHFFSSLYDPGWTGASYDPGSYGGKSWYTVDVNRSYGSQAYLLSATTGKHIMDNWESVPGMQDIKMTRAAGMVTRMYYHYPALVQHVGKESVWGGHYHYSRSFDPNWKA